MAEILISAGDASGDLHAAAFAASLQELVPAARLSGLGGDEMEKAGVALLVHQRELAIGGLVEVLRDLGRVGSVYFRMRRALREERPDLLVLVDSPDFNLPLARIAKSAGVPVLYYVTPQVWAWRSYRVAKIADRVDRACVIFPFERELFADAGLQADFVGHPLVDRIPKAVDPEERRSARERLGMVSEGPLVALLPGSRRNEIEHCLPLFLDAAKELAREVPEATFAIGVAASIGRQEIEGFLGPETRIHLDLHLLEGQTPDLLRAADVALAKPGTVTLELALLGTPTVVAARANPLTAYLLRQVSQVSSLTLPNLIAGHPIVPEFLQTDAEPERIARGLVELLNGPARLHQQEAFRAVARALGETGASRRAAAIAAQLIADPDRSATEFTPGTARS